MRIQNNGYLEYKTSTFRAVPEMIKSKKAVGKLRFSTMANISSISSAVKEIITKFAQNTENPKIKHLLAKQGISIGDTIKFSSLLGAGSLLEIYSQKTDDAQESLGLLVKKGSENLGVLIKNGQVMVPDSPEKKYMTQYEINKSAVENYLTEIAAIIDFSLLQLRKSLVPNMSEVNNDSLAQNIFHHIAKIREVLEENSAVENEIIMPKENKPISFEYWRSKVLNNTLGEVNYILEDFMRTSRTNAKQLKNSDCLLDDERKLKPAESKILKEILLLFNQFQELTQKRGQYYTKMLKEKCPNYDTYRKNSILNFKNIGKDNVHIGLFITHNKEINEEPIYTICIKDKDYKVIDIVSILKDKILKINEEKYFDNINSTFGLKPTDEFMSQGDVKSKDVLGILTFLKNQLERLLTCDDTKGIEMSSDVVNSLKELERRFLDLDVDLSLAKAFKQKAFTKHKFGGYIIKDINADGDSLMFTPSTENKEIRGVTGFRFFDRSGEFLYGYGVKDGKVLANYPRKTFSYAMNARYANVFEMETLNLEEKVQSCIDLLRSHIEPVEKALKAHKDSRGIVEKFPF